MDRTNDRTKDRRNAAGTVTQVRQVTEVTEVRQVRQVTQVTQVRQVTHQCDQIDRKNTVRWDRSIDRSNAALRHDSE